MKLHGGEGPHALVGEEHVPPRRDLMIGLVQVLAQRDPSSGHAPRTPHHRAVLTHQHDALLVRVGVGAGVGVGVGVGIGVGVGVGVRVLGAIE